MEHGSHFADGLNLLQCKLSITESHKHFNEPFMQLRYFSSSKRTK
jgi:hypothetical protein